MSFIANVLYVFRTGKDGLLKKTSEPTEGGGGVAPTVPPSFESATAYDVEKKINA